MRISQLAERSGVPVTTLRFYERAGLVPAERSSAGYRLYGQESLGRLDFIGAAKHLGLALEEIAELLGTWERGACAQVKADLRPRLARSLAEAEQRRAEVDGFIGELRRASAHLDALPDRAERCGPRCGFPPERSSATFAAGDRSDADDDGTDADSLAVPVACSLKPGELDGRAAQWRQLLADGRHREIDQGLEVTVPSARAGELAALCVAEQECCPFFDFVLRLDGPMVHLEVRAPEQARELVERLIAVPWPTPTCAASAGR